MRSDNDAVCCLLYMHQTCDDEPSIEVARVAYCAHRLGVNMKLFACASPRKRAGCFRLCYPCILALVCSM